MEIENTKSDREKIASRLKQARIQSGLTQDQSAESLGLKRPAISEIEAARRKVSAEEILMFADLYKVDSSWLLFEQNDIDTNSNLRFAARELEKFSPEEVRKFIDLIKMFPK